MNLMRAAHLYDSVIVKHPLLTKMVTGGVIGGLGDLLIQKVETQRESTVSNKSTINYRRLYIFTITSIFYFAPFIHFWFEYLESLKFTASITPLQKASYMILLDQLIGAILLKSGFFYSFVLIDRITPPFQNSRGTYLKESNSLVRQKLWPTLKANW
jgi:hypothetical protein